MLRTDKHFDVAVNALAVASEAIRGIGALIPDVSMESDRDSAEVIFDVEVDGEKRSFILKLKELED